MKPKSFVFLLIACIVLGGVSYLVFKKEKPSHQQSEMGALLFSDFPLNDVAAISIESPEGSIGLKKGSGLWVVENRDSYPADFSKISDLVKKVKDMKMGRSFKATPEVQDRLALRPPGQKESAKEHQGTQLVFSDANNQSLLDMVIGSKDSGAAGSNLQYVMLPEENKVYQVDKSYPFLGKKPADWIEQQLLNVKASAIYQVTCYASNQQPLYTLQRKEKGSAPRFLEIPEGQKSAQTKIDLVFDALSPLSIEDVATKADAASGQPGSQQSAYQFEYQLYNGLVYTLWPIQKKTEKDGKEADEYRVNVQVTYRQPVPTEEQKEEKADDTNTETDEKHKTATPPPELAKQLNTKLSPWSYMISKWVYDSFVTDTQAFIQKDEKEDA